MLQNIICPSVSRCIYHMAVEGLPLDKSSSHFLYIYAIVFCNAFWARADDIREDECCSDCGRMCRGGNECLEVGNGCWLAVDNVFIYKWCASNEKS